MAEEKFLTEVIKKLEDQNKILKAGLLEPKVPKKDASDREEEKEDKVEEQKQTLLFQDMAKGIAAMNKSFLASIKKAGKMGLVGVGLVFAVIAVPIIALVAFFKQLALEFMWFKKYYWKRIKIII